MDFDLKSALERLYALRSFGIKPGLETERALLQRLGNPQDTLAVIHVAGTNGKGSVCAMLDSILRAAGYRVGLYTSPHLIRFNERIRVDGQDITDAELGHLFQAMEAAAQEVGTREGREVTFFEFTTALALAHFRNKGLRLAVIETGLGGRLDATNVITPLLAVITRIGMDHTQYLGSTLAAIASEKGGIIKPGRPVVCGAMPEEALAVLRQTATRQGAHLVCAPSTVTVRRVGHENGLQRLSITSESTDYGTVHLPLAGHYQMENCATAIAALETLNAISPVKVAEAAVREGMHNVVWPGRFQVLSLDPLTILDGAHNPDAARALAASLKEVARKKPVGLLCGMCADKDNREFLQALKRCVKQCWVVPLRTTRSLAPATLAGIAREQEWDVTLTSVSEGLRHAREWALATGGIVCIAGSLYLVGEVLEEYGYGQQQRGW